MTIPHPKAASARSVLFLAWLPLAVLLPLAASQLAADPMEGVWLGARSALVGAVLMAGAWWLSERMPWPERASLAFYLTHLGIAAAFAVSWRALVLLLVGLPEPVGALAYVTGNFTGPLVLWDLLLKIVIYGLVVALSYALRASENARAERLRSARIDALATKAQLAALQAQLNPHFLFNTLHSLSVLIRRAPDVAEEAVDRLGELLRFALRHSGQDDVAFRDEYRFVENYLALEQLRLEERLRIVSDIDPGVLDARVPPFCVQPLVENAIRHGLSPREVGGTLWITARLEEGALRVDVRDDGVGAAEGAVKSGSGLVSLRQRLEARPRGGQLIISTMPGEGFAVTALIPVALATSR